MKAHFSFYPDELFHGDGQIIDDAGVYDGQDSFAAALSICDRHIVVVHVRLIVPVVTGKANRILPDRILARRNILGVFRRVGGGRLLEGCDTVAVRFGFGNRRLSFFSLLRHRKQLNLNPHKRVAALVRGLHLEGNSG